MNIEKMKLSDLNPATYNPRTITDESLKGLENSIKTFGVTEIPVINSRNNNTIVSGHQRYKALKNQGVEEIECIIVDLDETQEKALNIAMNNKHIAGEWNMELLEPMLQELAVDFPEFGDINLDGLVEEFDLNFDPEDENNNDADKIPDEPENVVIKLGDLIELGNHRLLCGSSTDIEDVKKLIGDSKIDLVFSDPPYGIDIVSDSGKVGADNMAKNKVYSKVIGDDTTDTAEKFYNTCIDMGMKDFIIWGGNYFTSFLPFSESWILWDKRGGMNSNNFADGEMAWTNIKTPLRIYKHVWSGMIQEGEREDRIHPNQKPVDMLTKIIEKFAGDVIYEGFGGSGSTLMASEKTKRKCFLMELDNKYVSLIIQRWCDYTERTDIKINGQEINWNEYKE